VEKKEISKKNIFFLKPIFSGGKEKELPIASMQRKKGLFSKIGCFKKMYTLKKNT